MYSSSRGADILSEAFVARLTSAIERFCGWLDRHGETSSDHQSFYASKLGRSAKALYYRQPLLGILAVSPIVFCEAFVPSARKIFWKAQRFPIADAHYAMGFAFLAEVLKEEKYYRRSVHFLEALQQTRCQNYDDYCWGYPFDWQTRNGILKEGTPLITTVPYGYEAFSHVYAIDKDRNWLEIMRSIARHAFESYRDFETASGATTCAYTPSNDDHGCVINASAYRAFLLTTAGIALSEPRYLATARRNLNFVLASQSSDGSWRYSTDGERDFIDHFHTCFVLKALVKIEALTGDDQCRKAVERGIEYYVANLFDSEGLPKPFSKRPRLTVYRRELYDYAECINLGVLLAGRFPELDKRMTTTITDLLERWQRRNGSFRARELMFGWDNVPMHRWAQSQVFRSLAFLLARNSEKPKVESSASFSERNLASSATN
jgi:hypothetical protein